MRIAPGKGIANADKQYACRQYKRKQNTFAFRRKLHSGSTLFPYIKKLEHYTIDFNNSMLVQVKDFSIKDFIMKHHHDDDEMRNIRVLLKNYATDKRDALAYKVLMDELKSFEIDLKGHSQIEEEILVPMAYRMEQKLYKKLDDLVKLN